MAIYNQATYNHILVPLDGSLLAECVLPHLVAVAGQDSVQVSLIRVLQTQSEGEEQPTDLLQWQISKTEAQMYLDQIAGRLQSEGLRSVNTVLLDGQAADRIIEFAQQKGVDLILLSSHGKSGVSRWNVSSVVRKIVQNASLSIMLVRAYNCEPVGLHDLKYRNILVPLDGSLRAEVALPAAVNLAQSHQANLSLIHIIQRPEIIQRIPSSQQDQELLDQVIERSKEAAMRYIDQLRSRLPVEFEPILRVNNNVSSTLQRIQEEYGIDLVILSAHGHSADVGRPFGSISTGLIEYGSVTVIMVQDLSPQEVEPTRAEEVAREQKGH
jgi:nucleotide-binding universal stress UspA family protein